MGGQLACVMRVSLSSFSNPPCCSCCCLLHLSQRLPFYRLYPPSRVLSLDPRQHTPQVGLPTREAYRCPCTPLLTVCNARATYLRPSQPAYSCVVSSQTGWTYRWGGTNPPEPALTAVTAAPSTYSTQLATAKHRHEAQCQSHLRDNCDHS